MEFFPPPKNFLTEKNLQTTAKKCCFYNVLEGPRNEIKDHEKTQFYFMVL